ncbi:Membrane protein involved in the export of O-antigen and teichoic acid [Mucilaginibacter pineti]|uniref:Membrane protein involved in the export of O-antigen and teichoic acid n=1 Tax=Mucilaginibacter pineti TaxID=1391627 RepID=A0A1G6XEE7_9SPHI|nr:lipopolysaccharide biosynthesis protein [Mucilaginibacter pineti]SDD76548.1 Membrane protein involved in the export of O-antigen and teichoic acid [Mucilaginibacter pineti]
MSYKQRAVSGILWSLWQQLSSKLISIGISIFLARILEPSQFGLIAMLSIFISVGNSLLDSGLTASLIRTTDADQRDYSTVFYFNIIGSSILYLLLFLSAPLISAFYNQPLLTAIVRVYGIILIINAFFGVQSTLLIKEMKFKKQTNIQLPAAIGGGILGIVLAKLGYGVWSLVWMGLCTSFLSTAMHWISSNWMPALVFDKACFKKHIYFGYKMTISGLIDTIYQNIYLIIIGKYFSVAQLGYYSRADSISQLPISNISAAINKVTYPMFAEISHDPVQLKNVYKRLMQQVIFWNAPVLIFLSVIARPLFHIILTDKWLPAVPFFQLLCISGIMYPLHSYNLNVLKVMGKSALFLKLEAIKKVLSVIGILLFIPFGIYGLLYFQLFFNIIAYYINSIYSGRLIAYPVTEQIKDILPTVSLAAGIGLCCYFLDRLLINDFFIPTMQISILFIIFIPVYYGASLLINISAIKDFNHLILKR